MHQKYLKYFSGVYNLNSSKHTPSFKITRDEQQNKLVKNLQYEVILYTHPIKTFAASRFSKYGHFAIVPDDNPSSFVLNNPVNVTSNTFAVTASNLFNAYDMTYVCAAEMFQVNSTAIDQSNQTFMGGVGCKIEGEANTDTYLNNDQDLWFYIVAKPFVDTADEDLKYHVIISYDLYY